MQKCVKPYDNYAFPLFLILLISFTLFLSLFLRVGARERELRETEIVYGKSAKATEIAVSDEFGKNSYGTIEKAFLMSDGNYLVKSTGGGGYRNGTVTVWTTFACTGNRSDGTLVFHGIRDVVYESSEKQSYLLRVKNDFYGEFTLHDEEVLSGKLFSVTRDGSAVHHLATGATFSSEAINRAVNAAILWLEKQILGTERTEQYLFGKYIDLENSSATATQNAVQYRLKTKPNSPAQAFLLEIVVTDGKITAWKITENGSTSEKYISLMPEEIKDGTLFLRKDKDEILALLEDDGAFSEAGAPLQTGATYSALSCVRGAAFAVANYGEVLAAGGLT